MYHLLFNEVTRVIEQLEEVQQACEEIYISEEDSVATLKAETAKPEI